MKRLSAASILLLALGCSDGTPTSASKVTAVVSSPVPTPSAGSGWTTSGTAWVFDATGKHAANSGHIYGWVEFGHGNGGVTTGMVPVGSDGRFSFNMGTNTTRVWVDPGSFGYKPCLSTTAIAGNVSMDAYYVTDNNLLGAHLPQELIDLGATLSGQVYEETPTGRQPAPNVWVYLDGLYGDDLVVATTLTDTDGRYVFCNMQNLPSLVLVAGGGAFDFFYSAAGIGSQSTFDVQLKRK